MSEQDPFVEVLTAKSSVGFQAIFWKIILDNSPQGAETIHMAKRKERPTPKVGGRFEKMFKGKKWTLEVVEREGRVCYRMSGKMFASPSGAAKTLCNAEVNGWKFWGMDHD